MAIEPPQDVDVDWRAVARALAEEMLDFADYTNVMASLDASVKQWLAHEQAEDTGVVGPDSLAFPYYMAASVLRDADAVNPRATTERDSKGTTTDWARGMWEAANAQQRADPGVTVLLSPRWEQGCISRLVRTKTGKARPEVLFDGVWRRSTGDLRPIVEAVALAPSIAGALCPTAGELDELPVEDCLARIRRMDPSAWVSEKDPFPMDIYDLFEYDSSTHQSRLTQADLIDDSRDEEWCFRGKGPRDAEIIAALLKIVPALWPAIYFRVSAVDDMKGSRFRYFLGETEAASEEMRPLGRLRILLAQRFEMMEDMQGKAWKTLTLKLSRPAPAEWQCEMKYAFV